MFVTDFQQTLFPPSPVELPTEELISRLPEVFIIWNTLPLSTSLPDFGEGWVGWGK